MKSIDIMVNEEGKVKVDFGGFAGKGCYIEAGKLIEMLKSNGIEVDIENVVDKGGEYVQETQKIRG